MADQLDTILERIEAQTTREDGLNTLIDILLADRADLKSKVAELTTALGEAANDSEQLAALNTALDNGDAAIEALRGKLSAAVDTNTPADPGTGGDTGSDTASGGDDTVAGGDGSDTV